MWILYPLNPEEIANTTDRMIKNPSQLKELAANGRKRYF